MSINFIVRKESISDSVHIDTWQVPCEELKKEIGKRLKVPNDTIIISHFNTGIPYGPFETIRSGSTVGVDRVVKSKERWMTGVINAQELDEMSSKARFFMIKSSNEENVQKAREHSVWATTFSNQDKLKAAFSYCEHVFLIFATNRSYELKGLARMESEPSKVPDKAIWSGVSNIRLGGNFKIRWIRKKPLNCLQIQKFLGIQVKDQIMRLCDGQQADIETCRKVIRLFEIPKEEEVVIHKQIVEEVPAKFTSMGDILGTQSTNPLIMPTIMPFHHINAMNLMMQQMKMRMQMEQEQKEKAEEKKSKKKKKKNKHKEKDSSSKSSSQQQSSQSEDEDDSERSRNKKSKKVKKEKKLKKEKKEKKEKSKHKKHKHHRKDS